MICYAVFHLRCLERNHYPPPGAVDKTLAGLPIKPDLKTEAKIIGSGDWAASISSDHSVAVACGGFAVKMPMGELKRDPLVLATERLEVSQLYRDISPPTLVIVAADGEGRPKPVIIQRLIVGTPACETPLRKLLKIDTLVEIKRVFSKAYGVFEETGLCDFAGQRFSNKTAARFLALHPFMSDNIIISEDGRVSLVDNIPDCVAHNYSKDISKRKFLRNLRLRVMFKSIDLLIAIQSLETHKKAETAVLTSNV